jgi:hypothetical protein
MDGADIVSGEGEEMEEERATLAVLIKVQDGVTPDQVQLCSVFLHLDLGKGNPVVTSN